MARWIPLTQWLAEQYGDAAPSLNTARRWCREGLIQPQPQKHGRCYFVEPAATYMAQPEPEPVPSGTLTDRIKAARHVTKAA